MPGGLKQMKLQDRDRLFKIYLALDDAYLRDATPSLKTYARIGELIDDLRSADPVSQFLSLAEGLLVTLHRLQPAIGGEADFANFGGGKVSSETALR